MTYHWRKNIWLKLWPLVLYKLIFCNFPCYFILRCEQEGKRYILSYYFKNHAVLMYMYRTADLYIPEYFRSELSLIIPRISMAIAKFTHNRGKKIEVVKSPLYLHIYGQIYKIVYSSSNNENILSGSYLPRNDI